MKWITIIILGVIMCITVSADSEYNYGWMSIALNTINITTTNIINITLTNINDVPTSSYIVNSNTTWLQSFYDGILTRFGNGNLSTYLTANGYNQSVSLTPYALSADVIMKQTEAAAFKIANVTALGLQVEANSWKLANTTALGYQVEANSYKIANQTAREISYFKNANATSLGFQLEANAFKRANLSLPTCVPVLEGLTSTDGSSFTCLSLLGGGGGQPNTAQWIANFTSFAGDNASIIRTPNTTGWDLSVADEYNLGNFTTNYNARTDRYGNANFTAQASGFQTETPAFKNLNFTTLYNEIPSFKNLNFTTLYNVIPYFGNLNFTTLYNAIPYFGVLNWTNLYDGRTDRWGITNFTAQVPACSGNDFITSADGNTLICGTPVGGGGLPSDAYYKTNATEYLGGNGANNSLVRAGNLTTNLPSCSGGQFYTSNGAGKAQCSTPAGGGGSPSLNINLTQPAEWYVPSAECEIITLTGTTFTCYGVTVGIVAGTASNVQRPRHKYVNYATAAAIDAIGGMNWTGALATSQYRHNPSMSTEVFIPIRTTPNSLLFGYSNVTAQAGNMLRADGLTPDILSNFSYFGIRYLSTKNDSFLQCLATNASQQLTNVSTGVAWANGTTYNMSVFIVGNFTACQVNGKTSYVKNGFTTQTGLLQNQTMIPMLIEKTHTATAISMMVGRFDFLEWGGDIS